MTERLGGAKVYFKRDELNHTGAHKINNVLGQVLIARRMGKTRIVAETGAGQHGVATATACAKFGLKCVVYMGAHDVQRQAPNVFRMKLLGADVVPVTSGRGTLKDAMNEAMRDWVPTSRHLFPDRHRGGRAPAPQMVRDFQSIIGREARAQMRAEGRLPDTIVRRSAAARMRRAVSHFSMPKSPSSSRRAARGSRTRPGTAPRSAVAGPAFCMATRPTSCRTMTGRSSKASRSRRVSTIRASDPNMRGCMNRGGSSMSPSPTRKRWPRSSSAARPRASFRRSSQPTPWRM